LGRLLNTTILDATSEVALRYLDTDCHGYNRAQIEDAANEIEGLKVGMAVALPFIDSAGRGLLARLRVHQVEFGSNFKRQILHYNDAVFLNNTAPVWALHKLKELIQAIVEMRRTGGTLCFPAEEVVKKALLEALQFLYFASEGLSKCFADELEAISKMIPMAVVCVRCGNGEMREAQLFRTLVGVLSVPCVARKTA
jgi:hypothetical protein